MLGTGEEMILKQNWKNAQKKQRHDRIVENRFSSGQAKDAVFAKGKEQVVRERKLLSSMNTNL